LVGQLSAAFVGRVGAAIVLHLLGAADSDDALPIRGTRAPLPTSPTSAAVVAALVAATDDYSESQMALIGAETVPLRNTWRRVRTADHVRMPIIK
jgi:hypothetical protein